MLAHDSGLLVVCVGYSNQKRLNSRIASSPDVDMTKFEGFVIRTEGIVVTVLRIGEKV